MDCAAEQGRIPSTLAIVGLGYVGLPLAVAFAKHVSVIGFDINKELIQNYQNAIDPTGEVGSEELMQVLRSSCVKFTSNPDDLRQANFFIIAVPTPVALDHTPDLSLLENACNIVGHYMPQNSIVVFESTVYPGITEGVCLPLLEKASRFVSGRDFTVGYSPERINPGDKTHHLNNIVKIVSGQTAETRKRIADTYSMIIEQIYEVSSIKVAEATKVIENTQRDVNIAFANEIAILLHKMGIDSGEVFRAMSTKWNALNFRPGLVGGHCIGVDPYYLLQGAQRLDQPMPLITNSRQINNYIPSFIVNELIRIACSLGKSVSSMKVAVLGITFKENCPDIRNSRAIDLINELYNYGISPVVSDPFVNTDAIKSERRITLTPIDKISDLDCLIIAVSHQQFREFSLAKLISFFQTSSSDARILMDIKGVYWCERKQLVDENFIYWSL